MWSVVSLGVSSLSSAVGAGKAFGMFDAISFGLSVMPKTSSTTNSVTPGLDVWL